MLRATTSAAVCWMALMCAPGAAGAAAPGDVIFNELMWMGSLASYADEWIELRNTTGEAIDLSGWTITRLRDGEQVAMLTVEDGTIAAEGLFLIANYGPDEENSHLQVTPSLVTTAVSLANERLQIRLYDGPWEEGGNLMDTADDGVGAPAAGDRDAGCAMARKIPVEDGALASSWHTAERRAGWDAGTIERGTPGFDNEGGEAGEGSATWGWVKTGR